MLAFLYQQKWTNLPDGNAETSEKTTRISCYYSVFHVLPFFSFPYIQNSMHISFSKNGFGYLIFPSNKASVLTNIANHSLRQNLLEVSCRQWIVDFTDICEEGTDKWLKKVTMLQRVLSLSNAHPRLWPNLEVTMRLLKEPRALRG